MTTIIGVRFKTGGKMYYFDPQDTPVAAGEDVIVETTRGLEYGQCVQGNTEVPDQTVVQPLSVWCAWRPMRTKRRSSETKSVRTKRLSFASARSKSAGWNESGHGRMHVRHEQNAVLLHRRRPRRLPRAGQDLANVFRTRIELRQIGVRDEAKMIGGLGTCGRELCCCSYLEDFHPVSINMAKDQNLSLNPAKISGVCGRLMCCLKYEHEAYAELQRSRPSRAAWSIRRKGAARSSRPRCCAAPVRCSWTTARSIR